MDELRMSQKERIRLEALNRVNRGELSVVAAAELMGLSVRHARRVYKRFQQQRDPGLVHRLHGRTSNRRMSPDLQERIVKRYVEHYVDFGPTLACEKLAEDGLELSPNTLAALLKERGLWQRRRRRGPEIRPARVVYVDRHGIYRDEDHLHPPPGDTLAHAQPLLVPFPVHDFRIPGTDI